MKRLALLSATFILLLSSTAFAVGVGAFIDVAGGSGEAEWQSDLNSWDIDTNTGAIGFVLDTAPTNERNFNYRLNVGLAAQTMEDEYGVELTSGGIYVENIFGFALVKNENFRWWAGPLLRVGFYSGESDTFVTSSTTSEKVELDYAEFGIGAVTGFNIKAGRAIIAPSLGLRFTAFGGTGETRVTDSWGTYTANEEDIEGSTATAFANVAVLF